MNRTIASLVIPLFLTSTSLADAGPEAPPLATLQFTLDGKPFQPAVLSLNGTPDRPSPGDLVRVGDLLLTLGPETICAFRSTPEEDGRLWLRTSDGKERVVGARIGWTFKEDKKVVFNPLARLSDEEILKLRGVLIDQWNDQIAERLRHIDAQRACVTISGNAGQPPGNSLPRVPSGLVYLNIESISGERFSDFSLLRKQAALRFLAVHTPGEVVDASDLRQALHISYLDLSGNEIRNLSELAALTDLRTLDLAYARGVDTLSFASRLSRLTVLDIRDTQVRDLTPLDELKSLRSVNANRSPVRTVPRGTLPELRKLQVLSTDLADRTVIAFAAAHPRCRVQSHWMSTLRDALSGITRFRVRSGETYADSGKERTFFETEDAAQIAAFLNRIQIDETQSEFSCMCGGDPSFEFYRGDHLVLTLGCQHGRAIRWPGVWPGDGALTEDSADALCDWLSKHGAPRSLEQRNQEKRQRLAAQRRNRRYAQVIPQTVLDRLQKAQSQNEAVAAFQAGTKDRIERVRQLLRLYGCDDGSWNLYSWLDDLLQEVLLPKVTQDELLCTLAQNPDLPLINGVGRWLFCDQKWKSLDQKALKEVLPMVSRLALGHPRRINRRMTLYALAELPGGIGTPFLRLALAGSIAVRKLTESGQDEPGGRMVSFRPGDDEVMDCSDQAVAGLLLAKLGDQESLQVIRRLVLTAAGENELILRKALKMLEQHR